MPEIASLFGLAFDDYRRGFGVGPQALSRLWEDSLAARVDSTIVAETGGRLTGFIVYVLPGASEQYGGARAGRRRAARMRVELGWRAFWRLPLLFLPMGLAYRHRHARPDELYISLIGVDPAVQGQGVGQALLAGAEDVARAGGAAAMLLHTAGTNRRARGAYRRAGFELICTVRAPWQGPARIPTYVALRKPLRPDTTPRLDREP